MKIRCQIILEDWMLDFLRKRCKGQHKLCKTARKFIALGILYKSKTLNYDDAMYEARKEAEK